MFSSGGYDEKSQFSSDISSWDVSRVTDMRGMFWGCDRFHLEVDIRPLFAKEILGELHALVLDAIDDQQRGVSDAQTIGLGGRLGAFAAVERVHEGEDHDAMEGHGFARSAPPRPLVKGQG